MKYPVGTTYTKTTKRVTASYTVTDFLVTKNLDGEIVRERYAVTHDFLGATLTDCDVPQIEIDRALYATN